MRSRSSSSFTLRRRHFKLVVGDGADTVHKALFFSHRVQYAGGAVITPAGICKASKGIEPLNGAAVKASYCAVSRAERYKNES